LSARVEQAAQVGGIVLPGQEQVVQGHPRHVIGAERTFPQA
jgi:hypothetical protein